MASPYTDSLAHRPRQSAAPARISSGARRENFAAPPGDEPYAGLESEFPPVVFSNRRAGIREPRLATSLSARRQSLSTAAEDPPAEKPCDWRRLHTTSRALA